MEKAKVSEVSQNGNSALLSSAGFASFERTKDYELVKTIATHPRIYAHISDDFSPAVENYEPMRDESVWYVIVKQGAELLGMFAFVPENAICWKVHTCLLPKAWGLRARQAGRGVIQWIFENTPCLRIITDVPFYNQLALNFAVDCGLIAYGVNRGSYMKFGKLHDQVVLGVSKCH